MHKVAAAILYINSKAKIHQPLLDVVTEGVTSSDKRLSLGGVKISQFGSIRVEHGRAVITQMEEEECYDQAPAAGAGAYGSSQSRAPLAWPAMADSYRA
jgi:hypothetical protein